MQMTKGRTTDSNPHTSSRYEGLPGEVVTLLERAEGTLAAHPGVEVEDGLLASDLRAIAGRNEQHRAALLALAEGLRGNWLRARLLVQESLAPSVHAPFPWGLVAVTLAADPRRPDVLIDWARRLETSRPDDPAVGAWAAMALAAKGERALALEVGARRPDVASGSWVAVMAGVAADESRLDLAADWLLGWSGSSSDLIGAHGWVDIRLVRLATALLSRSAAAELGAKVLARLPPVDGEFVEDAIAWTFDLVEVAEEADLAVETLMVCAGHRRGEPATVDAIRSAMRTHGTNVRPIFAALVNEGTWSLTGALPEGFRAVELWNGRGAYDARRALDLLYRMLDHTDADAVKAIAVDNRIMAASTIHTALCGESDHDRIQAALTRCAELGLPLPEARSAGWYVAQTSLAAVRDAEVRRQITTLLRASRADRAHLLAREATFVEMLGPAPAGLLVDALIEGGSHGEAFQLAAELARRFPNDAVAGLKLAMTYVWYGRQRAAHDLIERSLGLPWRSVSGAGFLLRWASHVNPGAVAIACRAALDDAQFVIEHAAIATLLNDLEVRN